MSKPLTITIIGMPDAQPPYLSDEARRAIDEAAAYSGGARHRQLVAGIIKPSMPWIEITPRLDEVFDAYDRIDGPIVVFASGDPLFFGFGGTVVRRRSDAVVTVYQWFNSLQTLAGRINAPYQTMTNVSLTGRDWPAFDTALIEGREMIGVLTDGRHTPDVIARHMLEYGYDNYTMTVGQRLGNDAEERIVAASLADIAAMEFAQPNCLILQRTRRRQRPLGIADESLEGLPGRPAMITKRAVRLSTLAALDLRERRCLWDVGFCTGSVSIEARLQFSTLEVVAFERRPECEAIINTNIRRYGAAGIRVVMGDFMEADTSGLPSPDAIFIGGHGGRLAEMVMRLAAMLPAGGVLVLNSVSDESRHTFIDAAGKAGLTLHPEETLKVDSHNPITILKASR